MFIISFAFSLGPVVWTVINEIFPGRVRGRAVAVATAVNWGSAFLVSEFFLSIVEGIGAAAAFWLFAFFCAVGYFWVLKRVPETKGRSLEQIEASWGPAPGGTPVTAAAATPPLTAEEARLAAARAGTEPWRRWGPYLSERQWGTVREDYSADGTAWEYFPHDHARSRAYRWGEDGIAGICDDRQRLCFALALWNGADPILKERMFGLTGHEGNHGEDVKEYYFYLDNVPTHAYMKYLYKYPQRGVSRTRDLVAENRRRDAARSGVRAARHRHLRRRPLLRRLRRVREGAVRTTSSSASPPAIAARTRRRCTCCRRSGSATTGRGRTDARSRTIVHRARGRRRATLLRGDARDARHLLAALRSAPTTALFTENETNTQRLFGAPNRVAVREGCVPRLRRPRRARRGESGAHGTKAAPHYRA